MIEDYASPTGPEHLQLWDRLHGEDRKFVYVIRLAGQTPIKIGKALEPRERLATARTFSPVPVELLYVIPGYSEMEKALHRKLTDYRITGEWFDGEGVPAFLEWLHAYCDEERDRYWRTGRLPRVPDVPEIPKPRKRHSGLASQGGKASKLGHRWRTDSGEDHPVTVRHTTPTRRSAPNRIAEKLAGAAKAGFSSYELGALERELQQRDAAA